ncbi:MAG: proline dehydrogenase family protein [Thermomicrobiales bacterium]
MSISLNPVFRKGILLAASNPLIENVVARYGDKLGARRFNAGTDFDECLAVLEQLTARGFYSYVAPLGEALDDKAEIEKIIDEYRMILTRLAATRLDTTIAVKLTQVGLDISEDYGFQNTLRIVDRAAQDKRFVRISMEESETVDATLRIYRRLREAGYDNVGVVLQSYLYRSDQDLKDLLEYRPNIRIVKGAYLEPENVAYPEKRDVDVSYLRMLKRSLSYGEFTAIATHDQRIIDFALEYASRNSIDQDRFEFQMLLGVRQQLQEQLVDQGLKVRLAVPYGPDWYPYFMRRLAERPANLLFVGRSLLEG